MKKVHFWVLEGVGHLPGKKFIQTNAKQAILDI